MKRKRIGVIAGAFNPVTIAHRGLAQAALDHVDEIVFAIPRTFPHKEVEGASLEQRLEMLDACGYRARITSGGLYIDIAREIREANPGSEIDIVCGRDAADRIMNWTYDSPRTLPQLFEEFRLLVANRQGSYECPEYLRQRIRTMEVGDDLNEISSTEVRRRIVSGESWEELVPDQIVEIVRRIYRPAA